MRRSLPISDSYRTPIHDAVRIQVFLVLFSLLLLDGGLGARVCLIAMLAFWGAAAVMIWRRPLTPTRADLLFLKFGFLAVLVVAALMAPAIWHARGVF